MLSWVTLSVLSACMSAVWSLTVKAGLAKVSPAPFAALYSAGAALLLLFATALTGGELALNKWGALAGAFAGPASVALAKSFAVAPNPGFSMGVFRMQAVLTAFASYLLFGAQLDRAKVVGMLIACGGVVLLARSTESTESFTQESKAGGKKEKTKDRDSLRWLWLAGAAGALMTVKELATKHAMTAGGAGVSSTLLSCALMQTLVASAAAYLMGGDLRAVGDRKAGPYIAASAAAFALYQSTVITASKAAPNVGMVKAIDTLGLVLTTLGSHFLYESSLGRRALESVGVILAGVLVMCFSDAETRWWNKVGASTKKRLCKETGMCKSAGFDYRVIDAIMGWGP